MSSNQMAKINAEDVAQFETASREWFARFKRYLKNCNVAALIGRDGMAFIRRADCHSAFEMSIGTASADFNAIIDMAGMPRNGRYEMAIGDERAALCGESEFGIALRNEFLGHLPNAQLTNFHRPALHPVSPLALKRAIEAVCPAMSREETRGYLRGIAFRASDEKTEFAATDGFVIARHTANFNVPNREFRILPREMIDPLRAILDKATEAEIGVSDGHFVVRTEKGECIVEFYPGKYPDIDKIVPGKSRTAFIIDKKTQNRIMKAAKNNDEPAIFEKTSECGSWKRGSAESRISASGADMRIAIGMPVLRTMLRCAAKGDLRIMPHSGTEVFAWHADDVGGVAMPMHIG